MPDLWEYDVSLSRASWIYLNGADDIPHVAGVELSRLRAANPPVFGDAASPNLRPRDSTRDVEIPFRSESLSKTQEDHNATSETRYVLLYRTLGTHCSFLRTAPALFDFDL